MLLLQVSSHWTSTIDAESNQKKVVHKVKIIENGSHQDQLWYAKGRASRTSYDPAGLSKLKWVIFLSSPSFLIWNSGVPQQKRIKR